MGTRLFFHDKVSTKCIDYKKTQKMMKRVCRSLKKSNDLKAKKFKKLERHHKVMEDLRLKEKLSGTKHTPPFFLGLH